MPNLELTEEQDAKDLWNKLLGELQTKMGSDTMSYHTLTSNVIPITFVKNSLELACENSIIRSNIEKKYENAIKEAAKRVEQKEIEIIFSVKPLKKSNESSSSSNGKSLGPLFTTNIDPQQKLKEKQQKSGLNPKYTFENYIMGDNNRMAYAVAVTVSQRPGEIYNPVFIYSGVGLGKTHLLQAIGNRILETKPGTKVVYTTSEQFTNELIDAIQSGRGKGNYTSNQFRDKYRKADIFLIDDIQFFIGKGTTQEEFFHTFNALHNDQKQIIITSDRPPTEFDNLPERITSRFRSGMIVDIQSPTVETRIAILRNKRDLNNDPISNEVITFIAESVETNIRELEGTYIQVLTKAQTDNVSATKELAAVVLGKTTKETIGKNVNMNQILKAVCNYYSVKSTDIKGERRTKELVIPRQVAMYLIKEMTQTPFMTIGDFLGGRDHSTIMHGAEKVENELKVAGKLRSDVESVKQLIYQE